MKVGMRFIRRAEHGWLGPRGDHFRACSRHRAGGRRLRPGRGRISSSRAIGGSKPAPSAPTSSLGLTAGLVPCRSTRPTRRLSAPGCSRTSASTPRAAAFASSVVENAVINRIAFEGNSRVKDEQLKLEIQSKERGTLSRAAVQSDVQRIVEVYRRSGRFDVNVDPKIIELPNSRVDLVFEIKEGRQDQYQDDQVRRQPRLFLVSAQRRHQDLRDQPALVPADQQRLRSRPPRGRPRTVAPVLSEARLYRRPHRRGDGEYDPARKGFLISFRSRKASSTASAPSMSCRTSTRSIRRSCARVCGSRRATSTTPTRSKRPSRT